MRTPLPYISNQNNRKLMRIYGEEIICFNVLVLEIFFKLKALTYFIIIYSIRTHISLICEGKAEQKHKSQRRNANHHVVKKKKMQLIVSKYAHLSNRSVKWAIHFGGELCGQILWVYTHTQKKISITVIII